MVIYILSHHDFDGYAASEILRRYYSRIGENLKIYNFSIKDFIKKLPKIIEKAKDNDIIYVTDFCIDIFKRIKVNSLEGKRIVWIDHHLFSNESYEIFKDKIEFYYNKEHSAAYNTYMYLKEKFGFEDEVSKTLAEFSDKIDLFKLDEESYKLFEIITIFGAQDIIKYITSSNPNNIWSDGLLKMYEKAHKKLENIYNELKSKIYTFYVKNYKIGIVYLPNLEYASIIADYFRKRDNYNALCFVGKQRLSLRSEDKKQNSNAINVQVIAKEFGGGGHFAAAGAYLKTTWREKLQMMFFKKVPKRIIEKLKKAFEKYYG